MVRLSQIYTKTGDDGTTGLGDGSRVIKHDPRVEAYGAVDEANAAIGVCVVEAERVGGGFGSAVAGLLRNIQNDLFDVGADLCCPIEAQEAAGSRLRVLPAQTQRLETLIDEYNARLKPLSSFVLPGGSALAASLHVARTVTRRCERRIVELCAKQVESTSTETIRYVNRLSDLLFVLSRVANDDGRADVQWAPGAQRGGTSKG